MTHLVLVIVAMFGLVACGGAQPEGSSGASSGDTSGGEDSGGDATGGEGGGSAAGAPAGANEFKVGKSDPSSRGGGVNPSKIEATATEAAIRFIVVDKDKGPIPGIVVSLTSPDGKKFYTEETDAKGFAEVLVPVGKKYGLVYLSLGRKNVSAQVPVPDAPNQNIKLTLRYKRYRPPAPPKAAPGAPPPPPPTASPRFVLKGVEFDTGKAVVREESYARLDTVVEYMTHKKSARIEISGHTDNKGSAKSNKALSKKRAQSCADYVIASGIDPSRVDAVGYGDERPIASNDTDKGRQQNRRIEATELE